VALHAEAGPGAPLERRLPDLATPPTGEQLLELFLGYVEELGVELYPAQEEAMLEVFSGNNVVLNTPTGSGKSLVALAACFKALAEGRFAYYTAPIKALVSEKFFDLCAALGPHNVGMLTGDASVNRDAPVLCCTAEILANVALRKGRDAHADMVVMDEFHYYSDRDRGVAWQLPLLTLPDSRFLLMSATLGKPEFFVEELERRTGAPARLVRSLERPVPLDYEYSETPLEETIQRLVGAAKAPIYIVHFSQRAAVEKAQDLMSLNFTSKEEKQQIKLALRQLRFDSPFGRELARFLPHGIGVHHAGMLPKYRRLVERLAQRGLLRIICGTDTLGVGVNVPIRSVLFTQLCKFDGEQVVLLSVRDFQQIAGRAGRRGFDTRGSVVVQAPEHEIENGRLKARAAGDPKKLKKLHLKKPPERGYKPWNANTLALLRDSEPEPLVSRFSVNHGLLLNVLSRPSGCQVGRRILRDCHEPPARKRRLLRESIELFRSLLSSEILSLQAGKVSINATLQQDFSLHQALSLYAVEALEALDRSSEHYALTLLSVVEAILESPGVILQAQVNWLRTARMAELKMQGVEYEQRIEELEKVEYPKPEAEFIYESFNLFSKHHPWVTGHNIAPKSIVRDMHEQVLSFNDYIKEYGLARAEGVLLRYLSDAYRTLRRSIPDDYKTEAVQDLESWLGAELLQIDASLLEEWEKLERPEAELAAAEAGAPEAPTPVDITKDRRAFAILVRNACFRLLRAFAAGDYARLLSVLGELAPEEPEPGADATGAAAVEARAAWTRAALESLIAPYWAAHPQLMIDAAARSAARCQLDESPGDHWLVRQVLSDPEEDYDWALRLRVDLEASRRDGRLVLELRALENA
jgi:superfamily II RNA helicase